MTLSQAAEGYPEFGTLGALKQDRKRCKTDGKPYPEVLGMKGTAELYDLEALRQHRRGGWPNDE